MKKFLLAMSVVALGFGAQQAGAIERGDAANGKQLSAPCAACHGVDGNSPNAQFPRIAGQYPDYLVKVLHDYKTGRRDNAIMRGMTANLSDSDIEDLAAYYGQQSGTLHAVPLTGAR